MGVNAKLQMLKSLPGAYESSIAEYHGLLDDLTDAADLDEMYQVQAEREKRLVQLAKWLRTPR